MWWCFKTIETSLRKAFMKEFRRSLLSPIKKISQIKWLSFADKRYVNRENHGCYMFVQTISFRRTIMTSETRKLLRELFF
jgi:hypothetical protein